ncbi:MAG: hypothetical protein R3E39_10925 [Anaerolineae bacterium]
MLPTRTPTFLRNNWPLLAAGLLLVLGGVYFLASLPLNDYSAQSPPIIYPLIAFSSASILIFFIISLLALIILPIWTADKLVSQILYMGLILIGLFISLYISASTKTPSVIILAVIVTLLFALFISSKGVKSHQAGRPIVQSISIVLLVNIVSCSSCAMFAFDGLEHRQSFWFKGHVYNLALRIADDWDYTYRTIAVYECDNLGMTCKQHRLSEIDDAFLVIETIPENIKLLVKNNALYLNVGDKTELIAP